ncbi:hypothetical protein [Actinokineospora inagensis]|uniref:hypothetical protein n=1 Tax=Actinokineospora inagensis TaxID=103730 RepID=UPI0004216DD0|nr:hypothetical protein [Actinokineospora inagensis]
MRNQRLRDLIGDQVRAHPEVKSVESVDHGKAGRVQKVTFTDGVVVELLITSTSPAGGDDHAQPEKIVTKQRG